MFFCRANGSFEITKFLENAKSKGLDQVRNEICFLRQSWTKGCKEILKMNQTMFFYEMFDS